MLQWIKGCDSGFLQINQPPSTDLRSATAPFQGAGRVRIVSLTAALPHNKSEDQKVRTVPAGQGWIFSPKASDRAAKAFWPVQ